MRLVVDFSLCQETLFWIRLLRRICKAFVPGFLSGSVQPRAGCRPARARAGAFPMSGMVEHRSQHGRLHLPQQEHRTRGGRAYQPDREKSQHRDGTGVWGVSLEARADTGEPPSPGELWRALRPTTSAPSHSNSFSQCKERVRINGPHLDLQQNQLCNPSEGAKWHPTVGNSQRRTAPSPALAVQGSGE